MSEHPLDDQFDLQREEPRFWWIKAESLRRAAELCWESYSSAWEKYQSDPEGYRDANKNAVDDRYLSHVYFFLSGMGDRGLFEGHRGEPRTRCGAQPRSSSQSSYVFTYSLSVTPDTCDGKSVAVAGVTSSSSRRDDGAAIASPPPPR